MPKTDDRSQTFSCMKCGVPYTVYPPQTGYEIAKLEPCTEGCNKEMNMICKNCSNHIKIYWCTGHYHVVSTGGSFEVE